MSTLPVYNPAVPYLGKIPGGLSHGVMIRIRAHISHVLTRFIQINVQTGPALGPSDDINLHLSIRPDQNVIVRNHLKNQAWGTEERTGGCPVQRGQIMEMLILAQSHCFKVAINGKHFCEFNHRLPLTSAQFIHVVGEMTIESITMGGDAPPSAPPMPYNQPMTAEVYNTPSYQPIHQQIVNPPYTPMHQQISGSPYQPPLYPSMQSPNLPPYHQSPNVPSYQSPNVPPYQSPNVPPYPTHAPYPYPSSGGTFHTPPYGNQPYGSQPPIALHHSTATATQPHYQTPTYYQQQQQQQYQPTITTTKPKNNTALKYAAGIGGIGLGAYVLSKAFQSDSDSD